MTTAIRILRVVQASPGLTEREIAESLFGKAGYQQRVNPDCRWLWDEGLVERRGYGGAGDPYRYHLVDPKKWPKEWRIRFEAA